MFAHRKHLTPFHPAFPHFGKLIQQNKTVSSKRHMTISWFNTADETYSSEPSPQEQFERPDDEGTPDLILFDKQHTSSHEITRSILLLVISQQAPTAPIDQTTNN